jgi:hypothetical protein
MRLTIDVTADGNVVTVEGDDKKVVVCESIRRMASQVVILQEVIRGEEVDSLYFADVTYLENDHLGLSRDLRDIGSHTNMQVRAL